MHRLARVFARVRRPNFFAEHVYNAEVRVYDDSMTKTQAHYEAAYADAVAYTASALDRDLDALVDIALQLCISDDDTVTVAEEMLDTSIRDGCSFEELPTQASHGDEYVASFRRYVNGED